MKISVIGSGCATCKKFHETVINVVKDLNIGVDVEYSTDIARIVQMGLMRSPVLVIDGKPVETESSSEKDVKEAILNVVSEDENCCVDGKCCSVECQPKGQETKSTSCCNSHRCC